MNKSELIETVAESSGATKTDAGKALDAIMDAIISELKTGGQVVIPGFGTFSVGNRAARTGRNPKTGEAIEIKATRVAKFKAGKVLKEAVQD